jgi:hypothetical protein
MTLATCLKRTSTRASSDSGEVNQGRDLSGDSLRGNTPFAKRAMFLEVDETDK